LRGAKISHPVRVSWNFLTLRQGIRERKNPGRSGFEQPLEADQVSGKRNIKAET
jgi:hypothetical protein